VAKSRAAAKMNMLANKSYKKSFISSVLDPYKNAKDAILLERMRRELGESCVREKYDGSIFLFTDSFGGKILGLACGTESYFFALRLSLSIFVSRTLSCFF
jgi:hypothetical protein